MILEIPDYVKQMADDDPYLLKEIEECTKNTNGYFWGIMEGDIMYIADKSFDILESTEAFTKGKFTRKSYSLMAKYKIPSSSDERNEKGIRLRTDNNMDDLKNRLKLRASIVKNYEKRNEKTNNNNC